MRTLNILIIILLIPVSSFAKSDNLKAYGLPQIIKFTFECTLESIPKENWKDYQDKNNWWYRCPEEDRRYTAVYYAGCGYDSNEVAVFVGGVNKDTNSYTLAVAFTHPKVSDTCSKGLETLKYTFGMKEILEAFERHNLSEGNEVALDIVDLRTMPLSLLNPISTWVM